MLSNNIEKIELNLKILNINLNNSKGYISKKLNDL
jgi:hypothetical protein